MSFHSLAKIHQKSAIGKISSCRYTVERIIQETPHVYAVIEDRGTQIKVSPGDILNIDLLHRSEGESKSESSDTLTFDRVLAVGGLESEAPALIGTPYIANAFVQAEVLDEVKGEKLDVIMYKRRKGQRRKIGHRQRYLRVKITSISQ